MRAVHIDELLKIGSVSLRCHLFFCRLEPSPDEHKWCRLELGPDQIEWNRLELVSDQHEPCGLEPALAQKRNPTSESPKNVDNSIQLLPKMTNAPGQRIPLNPEGHHAM
uniref:Uncharacterized protein n=1 Tax=Spongospora subterranea TaxID=70186 RepID=A0A0H5QSI9_9EUKA|eukprot:CRZ04551.1 hypothetical protein [Spongospora subterranea]